MIALPGRFVIQLAGVAVLYFLAGKLGLSLAFVNASASAVWPATGIGVAALLLLGQRAWPAVAIGAFLVNVTTSNHIPSALAIAAGNTLECVLAVVLTNRFARSRFAFERGADILRFSLVSATIAPSVAASIGTLALWLSGLAPPGDISMVWLTWWLGDAVGMVLFAPLCALWAVPQPAIVAGRTEGIALAACLAVILYVVFGAFPESVRSLPAGYLMVPILLWSAFRFGTRATATMAVILAIVAVYRTLHQFGPFAFGEPAVSLLVVQAFVGLFTVVMMSVAAEVTASQRLEAEMRQLNETLGRRVDDRMAELTRVHDRLVEAQAVAHVGSWEWDVTTDSLWWSDEMCRIFGVARPPTSYQEYLSGVHPDDRDRTDAEVRRAAESRAAFSFDHRIVRADGEIRMLHARGRVEVDADGRPVRMVGIGHDITERKQAEEERAQLIHEQAARREAEEANRAKDAFLATLSHELRTPLNAALGWTHILRESPFLQGRTARSVETIYRNLLLQSRLVSDILDISRIAKGELPMERENVEVTVVVSAAIEMVREAATARNVNVDVRSTGAAIVFGDGRRLQQVAWNLLSNAVKFAAVDGRVTVSVVEHDHFVELTVEDDGPGIAAEFMPYVFEQFRQADASVTREHGGLGLGLAIAHHIVTLHEGTIAAANRPAGGAAFVVRLPRVSQPARTLHAARSSARNVPGVV